MLDAGAGSGRRRAGRDRPRQRRRRGGHRQGRDGRQRPAVERPVRGRAHDGPAPGPGPQHPPGPLRPHRRPVGAVALGGRRAGRQGARHHRARAHRQARRPAGPRLWHEGDRLRPLRGARPGPSAQRRAGRARRADAPEPTSSPSTWPRRPRPSGSSARTCWPRPSPVSASSTRPGAASSTRMRWPKAIRDGRVAGAAFDVFAEEPTTDLAAVRARQGRGHPAPRGEHPRGPGQGGRHDRRAGACWPWPATSCRSPSTWPRRRWPRRCGPSCRWPSGWAGCTDRSTRGAPAQLEVEYHGPAGRTRHPGAQSGRAQGPVRRGQPRTGDVRQRPPHRRRPRRRGRDPSSTAAHEYVNLIVVRGGDHSVGGTLVGLRHEPRIVHGRRPLGRGPAGTQPAGGPERGPARG